MFARVMGLGVLGFTTLILAGCGSKTPPVTEEVAPAVVGEEAVAPTVVQEPVAEEVPVQEPVQEAVAPEEVYEDVVAKNVEFTLTGFNFGYSLTTLEVNEWDTVTINFESIDWFHDWVVDEFGAATEKVNPWTPTSVTFVADKAGEYEFYCSVGSHRAKGMVGKLIVK